MRVASRQRVRAWLVQRRALAMLAGTALSVVVYLPDELLHHLGPQLAHLSGGGMVTGGLALALLAIVALMTYRQITAVYPQSGDAYSITRDTLGRLPRLLAGGGLLTSNVLAVAISISASVAVLTTLWPVLAPYRVVLAIGIILLSCLLHMHGRRVPTLAYILAGILFTGVLLLTLAAALKHVHEVSGLPTIPHLPPIAFLLLMGVGVGCTMIVSANSLPNGRVARLRRTTLLLIAILGLVLMLLGGTTWLAAYGGLVHQGEPILSQLARSVYGATLGWYLVQGGTLVILLVAAQTPFAGVTHVIVMLARDGELPGQYAARHDRRSHADGAVIFALFAAGLVLYVHASVTHLLPWYIVSACITFLLAQAGMASRCAHLKLRGWRRNLFLHGIAVVAAGITFALISSMTVATVTWVVSCLLAILIGLAFGIHRLTILARQSHRT